MNKLYLVSLLALVTLFLPAIVYAQPESYQLYTATGQKITMTDLAKVARQYDVVVFGEYHDNQQLHQLEADFLVSSYAQGEKIAISLEMFEEDVQPILNDYLQGTGSEADFLAHARPWNNYQQAYRPLVEFAKEHQLAVIAANIPRNIANYYAKHGSLAGIPAALTKYVPVEHRILAGAYKDKFTSYMVANGRKAEMNITLEKIENFYGAQCLKDDAMAENIIKYKDSHEKNLVIHYNGDFHSNSYLGVVEKMRLLRPSLKIVVITPLYGEETTGPLATILAHQQEGDIFILLPKNK